MEQPVETIDQDLAQGSTLILGFAVVVEFSELEAQIESVLLAKDDEGLAMEGFAFEYVGYDAIDRRKISAFKPFPVMVLLRCLVICHSAFDRQSKMQQRAER